jgi:hypothetical protein
MNRKCTPDKLKAAADDLSAWIFRHGDVIRVEPEIAKIVFEARDKAYRKWGAVTEREAREAPDLQRRRRD